MNFSVRRVSLAFYGLLSCLYIFNIFLLSRWNFQNIQRMTKNQLLPKDLLTFITAIWKIRNELCLTLKSQSNQNVP